MFLRPIISSYNDTLPRRTMITVIAMLTLTALLPAIFTSSWPTRTPSHGSSVPWLGRLPLTFIPNLGQSDPTVRFQARSLGGTIFFTPAEIVLALNRGDRRIEDPRINSAGASSALYDSHALVVRLSFENANQAPIITADDILPGTVHFFTGDTLAGAHTGIPTYARLSYARLYPGIDLHYDGLDGGLKGTYIVAPRADPAQIRWHYAGVDSIRLDTAADNLVIMPAGADSAIIEQAPIAWQDIDGRRISVAVHYRLYAGAPASLGFALGVYNHEYPLIIDPTLLYSTYLGGSDSDRGIGVATDAEGNVYITGRTNTTNFPTTSPFQPATGGNTDAFVTKINAAGTAVLYSTYLGGSSDDIAYGIMVDSAGNAYITGGTASPNFPTTAGAFHTTLSSFRDAFVTKLNNSGSALLYSTYLGGNDGDTGDAIAVDSAGSAYITGVTSALDFPTKNPIQTAQFALRGTSSDAFVTKLNPAGSDLVYSTYLGGTAWENLTSGSLGYAGIAVDSQGNAYVTGTTTSGDFPLVNAFQQTYGDSSNSLNNGDAFVTKINAAGTSLVYSTYLGGNHEEGGNAIAVDSAGHAYITGATVSANFPTKNAYQASYGGGIGDAFVTELSTDGATLIYSTYVGGNNLDAGDGIAVDTTGNAYIVGWTGSGNFPLVNQLQPVRTGGDAFVTTFNAAGSALIFSTPLGGGNPDYGNAIALDRSGNVYVVGETSSAQNEDFPLVHPLQGTFGGLPRDAFVAKIAPRQQVYVPITLR